jgi:branched-chain amino acid transport system substrate-binding protein
MRQAGGLAVRKKPGLAVEIVYADHQNKADVGWAIARRWFDSEGVDMLIAGPTSSVGLVAAFIYRTKEEQCLPWRPRNDLELYRKAVHAEQRKLGVRRIHVVEGGRRRDGQGWGKSWYFSSSDKAFGDSLTQDTTTLVEQAGGRVPGNSSVRSGLPTSLRFFCRPRPSAPKCWGLSLGGADFPNCLKQAIEFGLTAKMKAASLAMFLSDIHATGLSTMQGLLFTNSFY